MYLSPTRPSLSLPFFSLSKIPKFAIAITASDSQNNAMVSRSDIQDTIEGVCAFMSPVSRIVCAHMCLSARVFVRVCARVLVYSKRACLCAGSLVREYTFAREYTCARVHAHVRV